MNDNGLKPRDYEHKRYEIAKEVFAGFAAKHDGWSFAKRIDEFAYYAVKAADALLDKLSQE